MALYNRFFSHGSLRLYQEAFGSLFEDINIVRYKDDGTEAHRERVPIEFAPKQKFYVRNKEDPSLDRKIAIKLPRMGYEMGNILYATDRKLQTTKFITALAQDPNKKRKQYNPVPYDINFNLYIITRHLLEGNQIVEQILPFFTPQYFLTLNAVPDMCLQVAMPLTLNSVTMDDNYDGTFLERREIVWTLAFTLQAWLFAPISGGGDGSAIIKTVEVDLSDKEDLTPLETVRTYPVVEGKTLDQITAEDDYTVQTDIIPYSEQEPEGPPLLLFNDGFFFTFLDGDGFQLND